MPEARGCCLDSPTLSQRMMPCIVGIVGTLRTQSIERDTATGQRLVPVQGLSLRVRLGVGLGFPS